MAARLTVDRRFIKAARAILDEETFQEILEAAEEANEAVTP